MGNDATELVGDQSDAVGACPVPIQKFRQHAQCDVRRRRADKPAVDADRVSHRDDGIAGVRVDDRLADGEHLAQSRPLIVRQCLHVEFCVLRIVANRLRPLLEERAVPHTVHAGCNAVDVARMPVGARGNARVGAPPVLVHAGHHTVVPIVEAGVDRVDLGGRNQRLIEGISTLLRTKELGPGRSHLRHEPDCRRDGFKKIRRHVERIVAGAVDEALRHVRQIACVFVIAECNDRAQGRQNQQREYRADAEL